MPQLPTPPESEPASNTVRHAAGTVTIYHNPGCGTSRNVLALIRNAGIEPNVIEYLETPPDRATLLNLLQRMNARPREILREKGLREPLFQRMLALVNEATGRLSGDRGLPSMAVRWSFLAWANISEAGAFNTMHTHPGMTWSGVYYVDAGESPGQNDSRSPD